MKTSSPLYSGCRYPNEIISHAVWLCHCFALSYHEVEELRAAWGINVTYDL